MSTSTTSANLSSRTRKQILSMRDKAWRAGDDARVGVCDRALSGSRSAQAACSKMIAGAAARRAEARMVGICWDD